MSGVLAPSRRLPPPVAADPSLAGTLRLRPLAAAWWSRVAPPLVSAPALCLCGTPAPSWEPPRLRGGRRGSKKAIGERGPPERLRHLARDKLVIGRPPGGAPYRREPRPAASH